MGNPWRREGKAWFAVPHEFVANGNLRSLSGGACKLYLYLCSLAQKHSAVRLEVSAGEIEISCGLHHETARAAKLALVEAGRVIVQETEGKPTVFILCEFDLDAEGKPVLLNPPGFREGGGFRKYSPAPGVTSKAVRKARKLIPQRSRKGPQGIGKSETGVSEVTLPPSRKIRQPPAENPTPPISQVIEMSKPKEPVPSLKISEGWNISEGSISEDSRMTQEQQKKIRDQLAENPAVRRLVEKFGTKIVGIVDYTTGEKFGAVGGPGISVEQWERKQRKLKSGGRILTRDELLNNVSDV